MSSRQHLTRYRIIHHRVRRVARRRDRRDRRVRHSRRVAHRRAYQTIEYPLRELSYYNRSHNIDDTTLPFAFGTIPQ